MSKDDRMFAAIKTALDMAQSGYKVTPKDVYDLMEYEDQIEKEGEWDED